MMACVAAMASNEPPQKSASGSIPSERFWDEKGELGPSQLKSLQVEFHDMQKNWARWMDSIELWMQSKTNLLQEETTATSLQGVINGVPSGDLSPGSVSGKPRFRGSEDNPTPRNLDVSKAELAPVSTAHHDIDGGEAAAILATLEDNDSNNSCKDGRQTESVSLAGDEQMFKDPLQRKKKEHRGSVDSGGNKRQTRINKKVSSGGRTSFHQWMMVSDEQDDEALRAQIEGSSASHSRAFMDRILQARRSSAQFLRKPTTELLIALVILSNSVVVGIEVEWTVNNPKAAELPIGLSVLGYTFNTVYALEVSLRMFALLGEFFTGSQRAWNLFDLTLVLASVVEFLLHVFQMNGTDNISSMRVVRMVRISRILRVLRVARIVRLLVALRLLFVQIMGTLRSVFWALVLLLLILYSFAMIFAQLASEYVADFEDNDHYITTEAFENIKKYWVTIPRAMFTLYKTITGGLDWEHASLALSEIGWTCVAIFLIYLSFTVFAVLNVVVGVFCQSAIQSAAMDHENAVRLKVREKQDFVRKIRTLFVNIDASNNGSLTYHDLEAHLDDEQVCAYFECLGIDPNDAWDLFKLLDTDSSQMVDIEEFIEGCMRLRGPARAMDLAKVQYENKIMRTHLFSFMRHTRMQLNDLLTGKVSPTNVERRTEYVSVRSSTFTKTSFVA